MNKEAIAIDGRFLIGKTRGIGHYTNSLIQQLIRYKPNNKIIVFHDKKIIKNNFVIFNSNVSFVYVPDVTYPLWEIVLFPIYAYFYKASIIHFVGNTGSWLLPKMLGMKIFVTTHDVYYMKKGNNFPQSNNLKQKLGSLYRRNIIPNLIKRADKIFTVSEFAKKEILDQFNIDKNNVIVTYNTLEDRYLNLMGKIKLKEKENLILIVGGDHPQKNIQTTIDLLDMYCTEILKGWSVIICGVKSDVIRKSNVSFDIIFYDHLELDELIKLYIRSKILLFPSLYESFGLPLIEGLSMGLEILSSKNGATKEVAGDNSIYFDPMSGIELKQNLEKIITNQSKNIEEDYIIKQNYLKKFSNIEVGKIISLHYR